MMGAAGATVSVVTTSESEAGPSRFLVKARREMRYFVNGAANGKESWCANLLYVVQSMGGNTLYRGRK